jgi:hypothetical protein
VITKNIRVPIEDLRILTEWAAIGTQETIFRLHLSNGGSREPEEVVKLCRKLIATGKPKLTLSRHNLYVLTNWALGGTSGMWYKVHISNGGKPVTAVKKYSIMVGLEPDIPPQPPVVPKQDRITDDALMQSEALAKLTTPEQWRDWRGELNTYVKSEN